MWFYSHPVVSCKSINGQVLCGQDQLQCRSRWLFFQWLILDSSHCLAVFLPLKNSSKKSAPPSVSRAVSIVKPGCLLVSWYASAFLVFLCGRSYSVWGIIALSSPLRISVPLRLKQTKKNKSRKNKYPKNVLMWCVRYYLFFSSQM